MGGLLAICVIALFAGGIGLAMGWFQKEISPWWREIADQFGIVDVREFMHVGYIHYAGYLGGLVGLVAAIGMLWRARRRERALDF